MDNQNEVKKTEEVNESDAGVSYIDKAEAVAARIEKANEETRALVERQEKVTARNMLGGKSSGTPVPEEPKEETPREYAKRVLAGLYNDKR